MILLKWKQMMLKILKLIILIILIKLKNQLYQKISKKQFSNKKKLLIKFKNQLYQKMSMILKKKNNNKTKNLINKTKTIFL